MTEDTKIKILCVEDEQDIRENIADILRDEGYEVFEAENGKRGFESFIKNKPDLVISDIMMPEMDGYALLKLIRENKNVRNHMVPFIFLSALGQKDNIIKGVNSSANDYLVKPIDFEMMIAKVAEKTVNAKKVRDVHNRDINNIKHQVSLILPSDLLSYLDVISQVSASLKEQPYGPLPHRRYIEDLNRIYMSSIKLRSSITNAMDETVINQKLNADEDIFTITALLKDFVSNLSDRFKNKIKVNLPFEAEKVPHVKADTLILIDGLRKIFAGLFKADPAASVDVSVMIDPMDQMVVIFYLGSDKENVDLKDTLNESAVSAILDQQNCRFEISEARDKTAVLSIPSYRLIAK